MKNTRCTRSHFVRKTFGDTEALFKVRFMKKIFCVTELINKFIYLARFMEEKYFMRE